MAEEAGIYAAVWRPEENGITTAGELIGPLEAAIAAMVADPPRFERHNSPNGWGLYENFVPWLRALLGARRENPSLQFMASR